jgi:hypothetical protein
LNKTKHEQRGPAPTRQPKAESCSGERLKCRRQTPKNKQEQKQKKN